jgi:hypothetical protein
MYDVYMYKVLSDLIFFGRTISKVNDLKDKSIPDRSRGDITSTPGDERFGRLSKLLRYIASYNMVR